MPGQAAVFVIMDTVMGEPMVLMEWRNDHPFLGKLSLPGGKIEAGETEAATLVREAREEIGIEVCLAKRLDPITSGTWTIYPFLITEYHGDLPECTDAGAELHWIHLDEACEVPWAPAREIALQLRAAIVSTP